jgi:hypothetical protein
MKKFLVGFALIALLMLVVLYGYAKLSSAYPVATRAVMNDPVVTDAVGAQRYSVLIGMQSKSSPAWSCSSLIFYVIGSEKNEIVNVRLQRRKAEPWTIVEVSVGYYTPFVKECDISLLIRE